MMTEYPKIQTVWRRDPDTNYKTLLRDHWATPEFECLKHAKWRMTEKIDGTNIRVIVNAGGFNPIVFAGRTDRANIPPDLLAALEATFIPKTESLLKQFPDGAILYGEGFGGNIQKVGPKYGTKPRFALFDVKVGSWWLEQDAVIDVANENGIEHAPDFGVGNLYEMIEVASYGFNSKMSGEPLKAEGLVARPVVRLFDCRGHRIITKIKLKDFIA